MAPTHMENSERQSPTFDLNSTEFISEFGRSDIDDKVIERATSYLEASPVGLLADSMAEILRALQGADPRRIAKKSGFFARFTGADLHAIAAVTSSQEMLESKVEQADPVATQLEEFLSNVDGVLNVMQLGTKGLIEQLEAGRTFLRENPSAGVPQGPQQFDNPRERFSRRLANMATLVASHEMTWHQLRLARAQAVDMLDRYREVREVLLPVWRQHQLALANQKLLDPASSVKAIQAHEAMQTAVAASLKNPPTDVDE